MGCSLKLREDFSADQLRDLARSSDDTAQVRRLLAIAMTLEGTDRDTAAKAGGMSRRTLRRWMHRFNTLGPEGLGDRKAPSRARQLSADQLEELKTLVEAGADLERDGVTRFRLVDIAHMIKERFGVHYCLSNVWYILKSLGFSHVSARPQHPRSDPQQQIEFKRDFPPDLAKNKSGIAS